MKMLVKTVKKTVKDTTRCGSSIALWTFQGRDFRLIPLAPASRSQDGADAGAAQYYEESEDAEEEEDEEEEEEEEDVYADQDAAFEEIHDNGEPPEDSELGGYQDEENEEDEEDDYLNDTENNGVPPQIGLNGGGLTRGTPWLVSSP